MLELYWTSLCLPVESHRPVRPGPLWALIGQEPLNHGPRISQARGNSSDACCKSTGQTVQTRAVNQQARTMTPGEAETLLLVNTHHNSRLHNLHLHRNGARSEGNGSFNHLFTPPIPSVTLSI
ncbi:hypothetical protein PAMP_018610 [Pampus punctatissimus]